jgi:hypothetical protein
MHWNLHGGSDRVKKKEREVVGENIPFWGYRGGHRDTIEYIESL